MHSRRRGTNFSTPTVVTVLSNASSRQKLKRSRSSPDDETESFVANILPTLAANPVNGHLYMVYHDGPTNGGWHPSIYFIQSTDGGTTWSNAIQVNDDTNSGSVDHWQPVITVKPDGTMLFIAWYDRRNDPTDNSLMETYGTFATLPVSNSANFGTNFPISTVQFSPVFTGTNQVLGTYDPIYPPWFPDSDPRYCTAFDGIYSVWPETRVFGTGVSR